MAEDRLGPVLARGPLVLDAAMGTRLVARGLDLRLDDPALWNLSHAEEVGGVHLLDVTSGAGALLTNSFGANRVWLSRFGRAGDVRCINRSAAEIARRAAGCNRLVLGSIGPTASAEPGSCLEQAEALLEAGVDALLFETHRVLEAELALAAVACLAPVPLIVSLFAWPDPLDDAARRLEDRGASALGVNCVPGMAAAVPIAEALRRCSRLPLLVKPNAGAPDSEPADPASFARVLPRLLALGPVMIGGCCGTTEAHVAALRGGCYHGPRSAPGAGRTLVEDRIP